MTQEITLKNVIGEGLLAEIQDSYLKYLETSAAIYELNGDYATALFTSRWCDYLNQASKKLAGDVSEEEALKSKKWICHEDCWSVSYEAIKTKKPCTRECSGGITIYAAPIIAGEDVIGSNNAGVSNPPTAEKKIKEIAKSYKVDPEELIKIAKEFTPKLEYVFKAAKNHILLAGKTMAEFFERKQVENALKELQENYQDLYDNSPDMYVSVDAASAKIIQCNNTLAIKLGYEKDEIIGRSIFDMYHPDCMDEVKKAFDFFTTKGEVENAKLLLKRKDGSKIDVILNVTTVRDENGNILYSRSAWRDITERKKLEKQLQEAQRLEAVGQLAGGVAHDFNNALAAIVGYAELSLDGVEENSQVALDQQALINRANKSAILVEKLLAFSRNQVMIIKPVDINQIIEETISFIKPILGEDIKLVRKLDHGIPEIQADPTAVDQIITNLCINARDAMQNGGKITIGTKLVSIDEEYSNSHVEALIGDYVVLSVSDDGTGIEEETLSRIYEPFFTTKEFGKGSGLGLSMVYGLMKQQHGFVECVSELGKGTEFSIHFAVTGSAIKHRALKPDEEPVVLGGNETILLVEDDVDVLQIEKRGLERRGYKVLIATNGRKALSVYKKNQNDIDMVVTDVVLPLMSGIDFYNAVQDIDPDARFLFISGYADGVLKQKFNIEKDIQILKKPFKNRSMALKVREILDG